jgi:hypothetical protein
MLPVAQDTLGYHVGVTVKCPVDIICEHPSNISICICTNIINENPSRIFDRCRKDNSRCEYCKYVFYINEIKQH